MATPPLNSIPSTDDFTGTYSEDELKALQKRIGDKPMPEWEVTPFHNAETGDSKFVVAHKEREEENPYWRAANSLAGAVPQTVGAVAQLPFAAGVIAGDTAQAIGIPGGETLKDASASAYRGIESLKKEYTPDKYGPGVDSFAAATALENPLAAGLQGVAGAVQSVAPMLATGAAGKLALAAKVGATAATAASFVAQSYARDVMETPDAELSRPLAAAKASTVGLALAAPIARLLGPAAEKFGMTIAQDYLKNIVAGSALAAGDTAFRQGPESWSERLKTMNPNDIVQAGADMAAEMLLFDAGKAYLAKRGRAKEAAAEAEKPLEVDLTDPANPGRAFLDSLAKTLTVEKFSEEVLKRPDFLEALATRMERDGLTTEAERQTLAAEVVPALEAAHFARQVDLYERGELPKEMITNIFIPEAQRRALADAEPVSPEGVPTIEGNRPVPRPAAPLVSTVGEVGQQFTPDADSLGAEQDAAPIAPPLRAPGRVAKARPAIDKVVPIIGAPAAPPQELKMVEPLAGGAGASIPSQAVETIGEVVPTVTKTLLPPSAIAPAPRPHLAMPRIQPRPRRVVSENEPEQDRLEREVREAAEDRVAAQRAEVELREEARIAALREAAALSGNTADLKAAAEAEIAAKAKADREAFEAEQAVEAVAARDPFSVYSMLGREVWQQMRQAVRDIANRPVSKLPVSTPSQRSENIYDAAWFNAQKMKLRLEAQARARTMPEVEQREAIDQHLKVTAAEDAPVTPGEVTAVEAKMNPTPEVVAKAAEALAGEAAEADVAAELRPATVEPAGLPAAAASGLFKPAPTPEAAKQHGLWMDPKDMVPDPARFQFRKNVDPKTGVPAETKLKGPWNEKFAEPIDVWIDPETGKVHPVNGHHRWELATRPGAGEPPVVPVRAIEALTAKDARREGALKNIQQGSGDIVDFATFLREEGVRTKEGAESLGLDVGRKRAGLLRDAIKLANLEPEWFQAWMNGRLSDAEAFALGTLTNPKAQGDVAAHVIEARKNEKPLDVGTVEELVAMARMAEDAPAGTETEDLFKTKVSGGTNTIFAAGLRAHIAKNLANDKSLSRKFAKGDTAKRALDLGIGEADTEAAKKQAGSASSILDIWKLVSTRRGAVGFNELINHFASRLAGSAAANRGQIMEEAYRAAKNLLEQYQRKPGSIFSAEASPAGVRPADQGAGGREGADVRPEAAPEAPVEDAGQEDMFAEPPAPPAPPKPKRPRGGRLGLFGAPPTAEEMARFVEFSKSLPGALRAAAESIKPEETASGAGLKPLSVDDIRAQLDAGIAVGKTLPREGRVDGRGSRQYSQESPDLNGMFEILRQKFVTTDPRAAAPMNVAEAISEFAAKHGMDINKAIKFVEKYGATEAPAALAAIRQLADSSLKAVFDSMAKYTDMPSGAAKDRAFLRMTLDFDNYTRAVAFGQGEAMQVARTMAALKNVDRLVAKDPTNTKVLDDFIKANGGHEAATKFANEVKSRLAVGDTAGASKLIRNVLPKTFAGAAVEMIRASNIGLGTHAKNILSTLVITPYRHLVRAPVGNMLEAARMAAAGDYEGAKIEMGLVKDRVPGVAKQWYNDFVSREAFDSGLRQAKDMILERSYLSSEAKYVEGGLVRQVPGKLGTFLRASLNALGIPDALGEALNESAILWELAYRRAAREGHKGAALEEKIRDYVQNPTPADAAEANRSSRELLLRLNSNELLAILGIPLKMYETAVRARPTSKTDIQTRAIQEMQAALQLPILFVKTPLNIFSMRLTGSPFYAPIAAARFLNAAFPGAFERMAKPVEGALKRAGVDYKWRANTEAENRRAADAFAHTIVWNMLGAVGASLYDNDQLTPTVAVTPEEREAWRPFGGPGTLLVKSPDGSDLFKLMARSMDPGFSAILDGANLRHLYKSGRLTGDTAIETMTTALASSYQAGVNESQMPQVVNFMKMLMADDRDVKARTRWLRNNTAALFVPMGSALNDIRSMFDPILRAPTAASLSSVKNIGDVFGEELGQYVQSRIPGLSGNVAPNFTALGQTMSGPGGLQGLISPATARDEGLKTLVEAMTRSGETPTPLARTAWVKDMGLTPDEFSEYNRAMKNLYIYQWREGQDQFKSYDTPAGRKRFLRKLNERVHARIKRLIQNAKGRPAKPTDEVAPSSFAPAVSGEYE